MPKSNIILLFTYLPNSVKLRKLGFVIVLALFHLKYINDTYNMNAILSLVFFSVSLDNLFTPVVCILSGPIQHLIGPRYIHIYKYIDS